MTELRGIDLKRACLVPSSVFTSPEEVVRSERLSRAQKVAILRRWEFDARRVVGHHGGGAMLRQVRRALQALLADPEPARPDSGLGVSLDELPGQGTSDAVASFLAGARALRQPEPTGR